MIREQRWRAIATSIKIAIKRGDLVAGARIASETDLAAQWNVSPMTVHRALTELQREGWVVRRPKVGTIVAARTALPLTRVGLIFPTLSELPQSDYIAGIEDTLTEGYQLLPLRTSGKPSVEAAILERAQAECDAVIIYASSDPGNTPIINKLAAHIPVVFVDRLPDGANADSITTDNSGSMLQGLQFLLAGGHRRVAYFMEDNQQISAVRERRDGYIQFMALTGVGDPLRWLRVLPANSPRDIYYERVEAQLAEMLSEREPITAVACQQAVTMGSVLEACVRLGVEVNTDLVVLGFNDQSAGHQPFARNAFRLVQRSVEMGHMAAKRVEHRLTNASMLPQQTRVMADFFPAEVYRPTAQAAEFVAARLNLKANSRQ